PVFLGGAALNAKFVAESCQPHYSGPIVYCRDAFEGLAKMREFADTGRLDRAVAPAAQSADVSFSTEPVEIDLSTPAPRPPFYGPRIVRDINLHDVYPLLNETALIRGRWGYRRGNLDRDAYAALIEKEVKPRLEQMKIECTRSGLLKPAVAYGYYKCRAEGDTLWVYPEKDSNTPVALTFPRQPHAPGLSIPDFFRPDEDVAAFMTVTLGDGVESESMQRLKKDQYQDYFLLHGFAVEVTDALAEFWHKIIRRELGIEDPPLSMQDYITQKYRGSRYGFGYPACPDLAMNKTCCDLVHAEEIDVSVSETFMMIPEVTTCALIAHHPQAKYFYMEP
ncbi:MAG: 5-methyltetrahydrofolate--homocysteine methyltransferase, partial [Spartobacteria bacterium]|nr:5-methyltetrahydrofolate--homocysteine methyltransferase [Spartobacteria bacterium]